MSEDGKYCFSLDMEGKSQGKFDKLKNTLNSSIVGLNYAKWGMNITNTQKIPDPNVICTPGDPNGDCFSLKNCTDTYRCEKTRPASSP